MTQTATISVDNESVINTKTLPSTPIATHRDINISNLMTHVSTGGTKKRSARKSLNFFKKNQIASQNTKELFHRNRNTLGISTLLDKVSINHNSKTEVESSKDFLGFKSKNKTNSQKINTPFRSNSEQVKNEELKEQENDSNST